jgi:hypothetical protein
MRAKGQLWVLERVEHTPLVLGPAGYEYLDEGLE